MKRWILNIAVLFTATFSFAQTSDSTRTAEETMGILVGTQAPMIEAKNQNNEPYSLKDALKKGPVVLVFYRGQWCPFCNRHLSNLQDSLQMIYDNGATLIAVSPEKPELAQMMVEKTGATFNILYDKGYKIENAYGVTFTPTKGQIKKYNTFLKANLNEAHSDGSERLPVPATYIIDQNGKIIWRHFNPNYKKRATVKEILEHL
jgi:peroxiredoxin